MLNFSDIISPLSLNTFLEKIASHEVMYINGFPGKFDDIFSYDSFWETVDFLSKEKINPRTSADITMNRFPVTISRENFSKALQEKLCISINHLDKSVNNLRKYCEKFENELGLSGDLLMHCYLAAPWSGFTSFHIDGGFAMTLQIHGTKKWFFSEENSHKWNYGVAHIEKKEIHWRHADGWWPNYKITRPEELNIKEIVLNPGDFLIIPPGTWHRVEAQEHISLSINLKYTPLTITDNIMRSLNSELMKDVYWRSPIPFSSESELADGYPDQEKIDFIKERLINLSSKLNELANDQNFLKRFLEKSYEEDSSNKKIKT